MSGPIRTALGEMADHVPHLPLPAGIYDRARRRQRRKRILGTIAAVVALATGAGLSTALPQAAVAPSQANAVDDMPAWVRQAPRWTARIEDAPLRRALVAYSDVPGGGGEVTLVGPDDQYRRYKASGEGRWVLSPDGRFLMTGRGLLDVTTGVTRSLGSDEPLAFSPDSRLALLARYDSDIEVRGEIRAIDPANGEFVWSQPLVAGPLPREVSVALAPDGSRVAVKRHGDLSVYDGDGRLLWTLPTEKFLAGQKAFLLERRSVALMTHGLLCLYDTDTGEGGLCHDLTPAGMPSEVVGWDGGWPIIVADRDVVSLQGQPATLFAGPANIGFIGFASERVRWSKREPGPPDGGPLFDRYRPILTVAGIALLGIVLLAVAIRVGRVRFMR